MDQIHKFKPKTLNLVTLKKVGLPSTSPSLDHPKTKGLTLEVDEEDEGEVSPLEHALKDGFTPFFIKKT